MVQGVGAVGGVAVAVVAGRRLSALPDQPPARRLRHAGRADPAQHAQAEEPVRGPGAEEVVRAGKPFGIDAERRLVRSRAAQDDIVIGVVAQHLMLPRGHGREAIDAVVGEGSFSSGKL